MNLVAIQLKDPSRFWGEVRRRWSQGEAVLPLDPRLPPAATLEVLERMTPSLLVTDEGSRELASRTPISEGTAAVLLTSGSTGVPKGVILSRAALHASADLTHHRLSARRGESWLCCVPHHHVAGFMTLVRSSRLGTEADTHDRFDPARVASSDAGFVSLVPTMLISMLDVGLDLSHFKAVLLGGATIPTGLVERAADAGAIVVRSYGMTETCGGVVYDGAPLRGVEVRIGDTGEIQIASPTLFSGYRNDDGLTAAALQAGWFKTSDVGRWDGQCVEVLGRADDMIVTGGEKVAPAAVEARIAAHPAVVDVVVMGLPDERWGSAVTAFVVLGPRVEAPDLTTWRSFVQETLPPYAAPRKVRVVPSIPRTDTGKLDRAVLLASSGYRGDPEDSRREKNLPKTP